MKRHVVLLLAAVGVVTPTMALPEPASAHTDVCAGQGVATAGAPLFLPGVALTATTTWFVFSLGGTNICAPSGTTLTATATISGWCGLSSGEGITGTGHRFTWLGIGERFVSTGEATGILSLTPNVLGGEDCAFNGADEFLVTGAVTLLHCANTIPVIDWTVWTCA